MLSDQQRPRRISPELLGIKNRDSRDRSWNTYIDSFLRANSEYLQALNLEVMFSSSRDEIEVSLKAGGMVGAVPIRAADTYKIVGGIVVQPRYGWESVGSLFSAIGWSAAPEIMQFPLVPGSAQDIPPWVIAGPALQQLELLLRFSGPSFRQVEEVRSTPRGQINWQEYCARQVARGSMHLLPCSYSDLDVDQQLRGYIRWALEKIGNELLCVSRSDLLARNLWERAQSLVSGMETVRPLLPDHRSLDSIQRMLQRRLARVNIGLECIRWILDERGLAGSIELDGLSWRIRMPDLFEQWLETLVRHWARGFGGRVRCARKNDSLAPISWERPGVNSLSSLIPDVVVEAANEVFVFDAKYKGFLEEVDERNWGDVSRMLHDEHRHDLHQVVAYSSMYQAEHMTVVLVYPMRLDTWELLNRAGASVIKGRLDGPDRSINIALAGIPVVARPWIGKNAITEAWDKLRNG